MTSTIKKLRKLVVLPLAIALAIIVSTSILFSSPILRLAAGILAGVAIFIHFYFLTRRIEEKISKEEAVLLKEIKERKQAVTDLAKARTLAELADKSKGQFLASMSHEIRTPMNGVIGMTDLLLDTELNHEQREYADSIRKCANSLLEIINDILDFSKIEAGKLDLEYIDFDLRTTLEDMNDILAVRAHAKGIELVCLIEPDVPSRLVGDPGRIRQIMTNLISNAIKFTETGEVAIQISLESEEEDDYVVVRFTVKDTGIGIEADKIERIFEPYRQAEGYTTRKYGGTGLGLVITKQLAKMMGGEIGVLSEPGKGSTFWFTLPMDRAKTEETDNAVEDELEESLKDKRILVVDDNDTNRRVLKGLLTSWKCRYDLAPDAEIALQKLRAGVEEKDPFCIAILDMCMPHTDGETLGNLIKADEAIRNTELVMMTSIGTRGDASRLHQAGFSAYLTKPIKQSQLCDCLLVLLGRRIDNTKVQQPIITRHTVMEKRKRKTRILLAEDNEINRKLVIRILEKAGYRVEAVENGRKAVEALAVIAYDLVLMDVQMPEMDGLEATRYIRSGRADIRNPETPIIALTAHSIKGDKEKCLATGMDDYISKPIQPNELLDTIARWLSLR